MKRLACLGLAALLVSVAAIDRNSHAQSVLSLAGVRSRSLEFTSIIRVPALPAGRRELRLWIPLPYEERYQSISGLRIESPVPYKIDSEPAYGNRYAYLAIDARKATTPFDIKISFHVKRFEHRVTLAPSKNTAAPFSASTSRFLQPDHLVPIDGEIAQLSAQEVTGISAPRAKARKLYDYVIATMHYDHYGTGWGRGDAVWACDSHHGNCTDFHSLFIGMARAQGIPARFEIGFPLPRNVHEGSIPGYHCWAQFYIQGIGWIPVDASDAWNHKEQKDYFFGALDTNRVMFSMGRDIRLNPSQKGDLLNYFVYPYAELDGKPFNDLKREYSFRDDPASPRDASSVGSD